MTIPQGVVGKNVTARPKQAHRHLISLDIGAFIAVNEGQIKHDSEPRRQHISVSNGENNLVGHGRLRYPWTRKVFHFVVDFKRIELAFGRQSLG